MKVSYNNTNNLFSNDSSDVLIEVGDYGAAIAWYNKETLSISGVKLYQFKNNNALEITGHLSQIFKENNFEEKTTTIFFDFQESVLVPDKFYNIENEDDILNLMFGIKDSIVKSEKFNLSNRDKSADVINVYRIEHEVNSLVNTYFPGTKTYHSSTMQVKDAENGLNVSLFNNSIKVLLKEDGEFKFIKHFNYKTPVDVVYCLLDVCKNYNVSPENIVVKLKGMIDKESNLYKEIEKYFMLVKFETPAPEVSFNLPVDELSNHYFVNLTHLIKCVS